MESVKQEPGSGEKVKIKSTNGDMIKEALELFNLGTMDGVESNTDAILLGIGYALVSIAKSLNRRNFM